jgi:hypothetical protein
MVETTVRQAKPGRLGGGGNFCGIGSGRDDIGIGSGRDNIATSKDKCLRIGLI